MRLGATEAAGSSGLGARTSACAATAGNRTLYFTYGKFNQVGTSAPSSSGAAPVALYTLWVPTGWRTDKGIRLGDSAAQRERRVRRAAALRVRALLRRWSSGEGRSRARSTSRTTCSGPSPCSARQSPPVARPPRDDLDDGLLGARDVLVAVRQQLEHPAGEQLLDRAVEDDARQARVELRRGARRPPARAGRCARSRRTRRRRRSTRRSSCRASRDARARARAPGPGRRRHERSRIAATCRSCSLRRARPTPRRRAPPRAASAHVSRKIVSSTSSFELK